MSSKDRKKAKKKSERQRKVQQKKQQAEVKLKQHRMGYQPVHHDYHLNPDDDEQLKRDLADLLIEIDPQEFESELLFSLVEYVVHSQQPSVDEMDDLYDFASDCDDPTELMDRLDGWNDPWMQAQYYAFEAIAAEDDEEAKLLREKAIQADPSNLQANHLVLQEEPASPELIEKINGLLKLELERFGPKVYETDSTGSACALAGSSLLLMMLLSKTQYELGQNEEAIQCLRRCIKLDSSKAYLRRLRLISMLLELGRLDEAIEAINEHEDQFGLGLILPYASALKCYLSGDMADANEFLEIGMENNLPFIVELIELEELKAKREYQDNPLAVAGMIGVELLGNAWKTYPASGDWLSERMAIKMRAGISRPSAKECGLCGKTSK